MKKLFVKIFTKFNNMLSFEKGIDITDDYAVLKRKNIVIKNIIFFSNITYTLILFLISLLSNGTSNWVLTIIFVPVTFGLNRQKKDRPMMYTITGVHGYGGGRKNGGKINNLVEMSDKVIADVYVMGHTHTPIMTRNSIFVPDYQHKTLVQKDKYYLMTNSFLEYGGYGETYGFTPSTTDHQEMILDGTKKLIKIIM